MGNCGSGSSTETRAPAGPIMVLSHYRLSPEGGKKVVHAGLQVLSTRHCGTTGVERMEHYVQNLSHASALNYLYAEMLVCVCVCIYACLCSVSLLHVLIWVLAP